MLRRLNHSPKSQEELLLSLVQHRGGDGNDHDRGADWLSKRYGWKLSNVETACDWEGIECNAEGHVIALLIGSTGLSATIPSELGELTTLEKIEMQGNSLYGSIPMELASLPNLEYLDLSQNRLTGTLPTSFSSTVLETLHLDRNGLYGTLPGHYSKSKSDPPFIISEHIQDLSLHNNRLSGTIPSSITHLNSLDKLNLSFNQLSGTIPADIGRLSLLQHLHLDNNYFVGMIPSSIASFHPTHYNDAKVTQFKKTEMNYLQVLTLENNQLSGEIPIQFAELTNLREFLIYDNKLTGIIPSDLCSSDVNIKFFADLPLNQDKHYCDAIACPIDHVAGVGNVYPCIPCYNAHYNPYIGQAGSCNTATSQREIISIFHDRTTRDGSWNDHVEGNDENIPWDDEEQFLCDYTGITCDESNHITEIKLKGRGLKGTIPAQIGFLKYLQVLDLSDNELSGLLPSDLRWAPLTELDISGNHIKGVVPPTLCLKSGINGNGVDGSYSCDHIACPAGTYSSTGKETSNEKCRECYHPEGSVSYNIIGFKHCRSMGMRSGIFGIIVACSTLAFAVIMFFLLRWKRKNKKPRGISLSTHNPKYLNNLGLGQGSFKSGFSDDAEDEDIVQEPMRSTHNPKSIFKKKRGRPSRAVRRQYEQIGASEPSRDAAASAGSSKVVAFSDSSSQSGSLQDSSSTASHLDNSNSKGIELIPTGNEAKVTAGMGVDNMSVASGSSRGSRHSRRTRRDNQTDIRSIASDDSSSKKESIWLDVPNIS